jgi:hypothetical protein
MAATPTSGWVPQQSTPNVTNLVCERFMPWLASEVWKFAWSQQPGKSECMSLQACNILYFNVSLVWTLSPSFHAPVCTKRVIKVVKSGQKNERKREYSSGEVVSRLKKSCPDRRAIQMRVSELPIPYP